MATFTSKPVIINKAAEEVADKFSDLSRMQDVLNQLSDEERGKIGDIELTRDKIIIRTQQVGEISFVVSERSAQRIVMDAVGSPVPLKLLIDLKSIEAEKTELATTMDVEIPIFLKAMVGGAMQKAVDQFGQLMQQLA